MRRAPSAAARPVADDLKQGPIILAIFLATQFLDGALTYWGVTKYGIQMEMNALLTSWMHQFGPGATLFAAKALACSCGLVLYLHAYLRPLAAVAGLCLGFAVVPWLFVVAWTA